MRFTLFERIPHQRLPLLQALVVFEGKAIYPALPFVIDTAAERSIITPSGEASLKLNEPEVAWDKLFVHGGGDTTVDTILGEGTFKRLEGPARLRFLSHDNTTTWDANLDYLLFSDDSRLAAHKVIPGKRLPFSILGQDVLRQCGVVCVHGRGILTPDRDDVEKAIAKLMKYKEKRQRS